MLNAGERPGDLHACAFTPVHTHALAHTESDEVECP